MQKNLAKLSFFAVAVMWGSSFAFQKGLTMDIGAVSFTFWNFFISALVFCVYAIFARIDMLTRWREGVVLGLFLSGVEILQMVGLQYSSASDTAFLSNIGMLLIPFCGWVAFRHRLKKENLIAVLLAIVGMYFLVGGVDGFGVGELSLLCSAVFIALYFAYSEKYEASGKSHLLPLCIQQFFVISVMCLVIGFFFHTSFHIESAQYYTLGWQIVIFTTVPYFLVQWASKYSDEMVASLYDGIVEPLVGGIVAWVIFLEPTTPLQVAGGILMVFAFGVGEIFTKKHFLRKILGLRENH